jgi:hypothetical protein
MDFPRRLIARGGTGLPSRVEPHIYKLPSYSKFTRKKERVSESDSNWMIRPDAPGSDPTRLNENIRYYAAGVNPSVEIEYQNRGSNGTRTHSLHQNQVGSNFRLDVVRPPLFPVETLHSLSNPRTHQTISVETNPGLSPGYATNTLAYDFDTWDLGNSVSSNRASGPKTIQSSTRYILDTPSVMSATYAINENRPEAYEMMSNPKMPMELDQFTCREESPYGTIVRPTYSVTSNPKFKELDSTNTDASAKVRKEVLFQNIRPNFNIVVYDPTNHISTDISANVRQKNYIAVQAALGQPISLERQDGTSIKLKDYTWTGVNTNLGIDQLILSIEDPHIELERNLPLYATATGLVAPTDVLERKNDEYDLEGRLQVYAQPSVDLSTYYGMDNSRNISGLDTYTKPAMNFSFDNQTSPITTQFTRELPQLRDTSRLQRAAGQEYERSFD